MSPITGYLIKTTGKLKVTVTSDTLHEYLFKFYRLFRYNFDFNFYLWNQTLTFFK